MTRYLVHMNLVSLLRNTRENKPFEYVSYIFFQIVKVDRISVHTDGAPHSLPQWLDWTKYPSHCHNFMAKFTHCPNFAETIQNLHILQVLLKICMGAVCHACDILELSSQTFFDGIFIFPGNFQSRRLSIRTSVCLSVPVSLLIFKATSTSHFSARWCH